MSEYIEKTNYLIEQLKKRNVVIQRYDSFSSKSIYLKLDFGVAGTIRISDHAGKEHLKYRFNLQSNLKNRTHHKKTNQHFFPTKQINNMLFTILKERDERIEQYGREAYLNYMYKNWAHNKDNSKGFWSMAKLVYVPQPEEMSLLSVSKAEKTQPIEKEDINDYFRL